MIKAVYRRLLAILPPSPALRLRYLRRNHCLPYIANARTFNEKIQWRKLYDRNPIFPLMLDKLEAKKIMLKITGPEWHIPVLWEGKSPEEIPLDSLQLPYVIKANHGSGFNLICVEGTSVGKDDIHRECKSWLNTDYSKLTHEWGYSGIERRLFVEVFIGQEQVVPDNIEVWVFGGAARFVGVLGGRSSRRFTCSFFDLSWQPMPFRLAQYPTAIHDKPINLDKMIDFAESACQGLDFARIDFYEVRGRPLFGEFTIYPSSGFDRIVPHRYDRIIGDLWRIG